LQDLWPKRQRRAALSQGDFKRAAWPERQQ